MKILVTGGLGFIGSNFIRHILKKYDDVEIVNVDNLSFGSNPNNLRDIEEDKRYSFIKGDINDKRLLPIVLNDIDAVVNFAAQTHVDRSIADPSPFLSSNTIGVVSLLETIRKMNGDIRFLHISTDEVYGDIEVGSFKEEDRLKPSSPYAASKAAADMFILAYHRTYGLDTVITRCTNNFGPYQFPEKLIPKTIIRAQRNMSVPVYGTGKNVRDWIYVLDFCEAIDLLLQRGKSGEIYNVSAGNEYPNIEVVRRILRILNKPETLITFVEDRPGHDIRYSLDSSKIRDEVGWKPRHSFDEALEKTVKWYLENEWWWKPLATEKVLHPTPWRLKWS